MKTTTFILQLFLISNISGQNWFGENATWFYECCTDYFAPTYLKMFNAGDTIVNNIPANHIKGDVYVRQSSGEIEINDFDPIIAYENNNVIYVLTATGFDTLYNFNSTVNSSWELFTNSWVGRMKATVKDIGQIEINNIELKWMDVEFSFDSLSLNWLIRDTIVEKIGPLNNYFLPWHSLYLGGGAGEIRCYFDDEIGEYRNPSYSHDDCEDLPFYSSVYELTENSFNIFPNPAKNSLFVERESETPHAHLTIDVYNSQGSLIFHNNFDGNQEINLSEEPSQILVIVIRDKGEIIYSKKVLKK